MKIVLVVRAMYEFHQFVIPDRPPLYSAVVDQFGYLHLLAVPSSNVSVS